MTQLPSPPAEVLSLLCLGTVSDPWARGRQPNLPPRGICPRRPEGSDEGPWEVVRAGAAKSLARGQRTWWLGKNQRVKQFLSRNDPQTRTAHTATCGALPVSLSVPCSARNSPVFCCWHISRVLKSFVWVSTRESGYGLALHFPHITQILDMVPRGIHFNLNTSVMDSTMDSYAFLLRVAHLHLGVSGDRLLFHSLSTLSQWICTTAA